jgi:hypothetical protein
MSIYLSVASFVHTLKNSSANFSISKDIHITVWLSDDEKKNYQVFTISADIREPENCGYIETTDEILQKAFGADTVYDIIKRDCIKNYDEKTMSTTHCPVSKDPEKRGKIMEIINKKRYYCRLKP